MSSRWFTLCVSAVLLAITFGVYWGVFQNGFVDFDDNIYVTENRFTKAGFSQAGFRYAWTSFDSGNWLPITWLSYQLDATLFGSGPRGFHLTNLVLHGLNVLMLFGWLVAVTGSRWRSAVVAALFAVHPLHVESVAWVAERKDVLSAFWLLVALFAYHKYARRPVFHWYLATCMAFALGLMSKSMLVTFPLLLLLIDFWPLERDAGTRRLDATSAHSPQTSVKWLLIEKIPLFVLSLIDGIITIIAQNAGHAVGDQIAGSSLGHIPWLMRGGNALQAYVWYIAKTFLPTELCVYYPHPLDHLDTVQTGIAIAVLLGISVYAGLNFRRRPYLVFGWLWYLISLGPVIGFVQVGSQAYADRYSYIPHFGFLLLIVWESHFWLATLFQGTSSLGHVDSTSLSPAPLDTLGSNVPQLKERSISVPERQNQVFPRYLAIGMTLVALTVLSSLTVSQVAVWRTTSTLWEQALKVDPQNWFAHLQVGNSRVIAGRVDDATQRHFEIVLAHRPQHAIALNNLGWIYQSRQQWNEAEDYYRRSLAADGSFESAIHNLVTTLKQLNRLSDGLELMTRYADRRPTDALIQNELGIIEARGGRFEAARGRFHQTVRVAPTFANARYNLALALINLGRDQEAQSHLETLLKQNPNHANGHLNLGILHEKAGNVAEARTHYSAALQENPNDQEARVRLQALSHK